VPRREGSHGARRTGNRTTPFAAERSIAAAQCFSARSRSAFASLTIFSAMKAGTSS